MKLKRAVVAVLLSFALTGISFAAQTGKEPASGENALKNQLDYQAAAAQGDLEKVKELLKKKVDLSGLDYPVYEAIGIRRANGKKLLAAAAQGDLEKVRKLLQKGAAKVDVNVQDDEGNTALMYLAKKDKAWDSKELLKAGADVNATDHLGRTALMYAAENGGKGIVKVLIAAGADVNHKAKYKETPLMLAADACKVEVIQELLKAGANVNATEVRGVNALGYAVEKCGIETVKVLIAAGANVNAYASGENVDRSYQALSPALIAAVHRKDIEILQELLKAGAYVNDTRGGNTALMYAARFLKRDFVKELIKAGADVNIIGSRHLIPLESSSALENVTYTRSEEPFSAERVGVIEELVKAGADMDRVGVWRRQSFIVCGAVRHRAMELLKILIKSDEANAIQSLRCAVGEGNVQMLKILLKEGMVTSRRAINEALWTAAEKGQYEAAEELLKVGGDPNYKVRGEATPLLAAWKNNNREIFKLLLTKESRDRALQIAVWQKKSDMAEEIIEAGANVNAVDKNSGCTVLMYAAMGDDSRAISKLLDRGAKLNATDRLGRTALMWALTSGLEGEAADRLIDRGADINAVDKEGWTALMYAISKRHDIKMIRRLIGQGADVNVVDKKGRTPLKLAVASGNSSVVSILRDAGATK